MPNQSYIPAATITEAQARLFAIAGAKPKKPTKPPKRGLVALASALGLDVDPNDTNDITGLQIADALGTSWESGRDYRGAVVTLDGLNNLLGSASASLAKLTLKPVLDDQLEADRILQAFPGFKPAENKPEAAQRISDLTNSGPEPLGPGSKEQKSLLINLAAGIGIEAPDDYSKHGLSQEILRQFNIPWAPTAFSTQGTVTLEGLNLLLVGAERHFNKESLGWNTVEDEAKALVKAIHQGLETHFDGKKTIKYMRDNGSNQWRANEWQGFFFEERAREILNYQYPVPAVGGPRQRYGNTDFDYASPHHVWDFKAHSSQKIFDPSGDVKSLDGSPMYLNDSQAMFECIKEQGLGFIILSGDAFHDETGAFNAWHNAFKAQGRKRTPTSRSNTPRKSLRKSSFTPTALTAVWISDTDALLAGFLGGWITRTGQGRQAVRAGQSDGDSRAPKLSLKLKESQSWHVAEQRFLLP